MAKKKKQDKESKKQAEMPPAELETENLNKGATTPGVDESLQEAVKTEDNSTTPARKKNCECRKIGRWWYCMKQDHMGHLVLCDGPFKTQTECDELAVGDA